MDIKDVDAKMKELRLATHRKKEAERVLSEHKLDVSLLHAQLKAILEDEGRDAYKSEHGTFSYKHVPTFRVPKDEESRELFFNHLKEEGVFDQMITVHSATINTYGNSLMKENGEDYSIPGIGQGEDRITFSFRK